MHRQTDHHFDHSINKIFPHCKNQRSPQNPNPNSRNKVVSNPSGQKKEQHGSKSLTTAVRAVIVHFQDSLTNPNQEISRKGLEKKKKERDSSRAEAAIKQEPGTVDLFLGFRQNHQGKEI